MMIKYLYGDLGWLTQIEPPYDSFLSRAVNED
jgi:hypothetical protein